MELIPAPSPNYNPRPAPPDMIILHYTGMQNGEAALARLRDGDHERRVSAHYMVEEDGRVFSLVAEERRAWHAGESYWKGQTGLNDISIGIEIVNPGHEFGYRPFPEPQIAAVIELLTDIRSRWDIPDERILGHSDIAPARKTDPGELFPWKRLSDAGHGYFSDMPAAPGARLSLGDEGPGVFLLQAGLTRLGYDLPPSGRYDDDTVTVVTAFQRHWRPDLVDGAADGETRARLMALLRMMPG